MGAWINIVIGLSIFWAMVCSPAHARAERINSAYPPIQIITSDFPPYNYLEKGQPVGLCTEIVQALLRDLGIQSAITTLPWARAYKIAENTPNTIIYTIARSEDREDRFAWIGVIATGRAYLFSLKSKGLTFNSLDETAPYIIGAARNDIRSNLLRQKGLTNLDMVVDSRMNAVKLLKHRIDLWAENELAAVHTIRSLGHDPDKILAKSFSLETGPEHKGYLAMSLKSDPGLIKALTQALMRFKTTDAFQEIQKRYLHSPK